MSFSKLLGRDAQEVTPQQAGAAFAEEAKRIAREQNIDLAEAWAIARRLHPEAHARLCEGAQPTTTLANAAALPVPIPTAVNIEKLGLPVDATLEEFSAAYRANRNSAEGRKSNILFEALKKLVWDKYGGSEQDARKRTAKRFPILAKEAGFEP